MQAGHKIRSEDSEEDRLKGGLSNRSAFSYIMTSVVGKVAPKTGLVLQGGLAL